MRRRDLVTRKFKYKQMLKFFQIRLVVKLRLNFFWIIFLVKKSLY